jgi:hypothetical protein
MKTDEKLLFLKKGETLLSEAATGVSLHCHTLHSRELLDFVPYYAERIPAVSYLWRRSMKRRQTSNGVLPDFKAGYWEPPLDAATVVRSEADHLAGLGLHSIVSITDHDSINAGLELSESGAPISMEWTVPFRGAFFHVGVHNLPPSEAREIADVLLAYTFAAGYPDENRLMSLLNMLGTYDDILVILNHPIWDIEMIGQIAHERALAEFLNVYKNYFHALEVNGFRTWSENQMVVDLAADLDLPVVSGGDRHCCQPNTMINITDASNFAEFAHEIRVERRSRVAVMPEYHVPLPSRQLASIRQILFDSSLYGEERTLWTDRVFLDSGDGRGIISLTEQWNGRRPLWTYLAIAAVGFLGHPALRPFIAAAVGDADIGREVEAAPSQPHTVAPALVSEKLEPRSI